MVKDKLRIKDILNSIHNIGVFLEGKYYEDLEGSMLLKSAVMAQLMIIGEAAKNVSEKTKEKYEDIEWKKASSMRDILIHEYFGVEWEIVWDTIKEDLPILEAKLQEIYEETSNDKD
ncbi:MAG: hypothetical protein US52_C0010G0008 [candidate division WS6 bacterium GW2011_GWA2_37_6]|uniref:Nucleotidyltransferase n=1 Tax=candidate division WS6 bacterium GW2011_GWA2_37_6 TaxID=1619087 RepID=A0A0G0GYJ9_9BACT|nr:MAG: hypothetical protein US52_C0010G0008 [candidate division WS6 bacterium GW2011_GWA2_37_6]KKT83936.1 MAG: hypothetical protein UW80_C0004G0019 [Microgenomates group bacterium GW2011_GWC1_44_9]